VAARLHRLAAILNTVADEVEALAGLLNNPTGESERLAVG